MKTYILQKDLPDVKAGAETYTHEGSSSYFISRNNHQWYYSFPKETVENDDGTWFKLKEEEKPTAVACQERENGFLFHIKVSELKDKVLFVTNERIAEILIAESKGELWIGKEHDLWCIADLLSRCWFYGNMKVETSYERVIYGLLNKLGLYPTTVDAIYKRPDWGELFIKYGWPEHTKPEKFYTEKELLQAEEDAFNAARENNEIDEHGSCCYMGRKFKTFSDYKNKK